MEAIDINSLNENDIVKLVAPNKMLFDGLIKKVASNCIGITVDITQDTYFDLSVNKHIEIIFIYVDNAIKCSAQILGSKFTGNEQALLISIPKFLLKIERRQYDRLPIVLDIEYKPLLEEPHEKKLNYIEQKYFRNLKKTYSIDISAGGISFVTLKTELCCDFTIVILTLKNEKITSLCRKIREETMTDLKHNKVAFEFKDLNRNHRQLIWDFVDEKSKEKNKISID